MQRTDHKHIVVTEDGTAMVEGTGFKVRELVKSHLGFGWSPEELQCSIPI